MAWTSPPFALFVLAEVDVEVSTHLTHVRSRTEATQVINQVLQQASIVTAEFWLATASYEDAPKWSKEMANLGTEPPVSKEWKSPFINYKAEDVAKWLKGKPDGVDLDSQHFAVLDANTVEDKKILVFKIGDIDRKGHELDSFRFDPQRAAGFLAGLEWGEWEELKGAG